jgi:predicted DNA binding CopG/RHH family protein
MFRVHGYALTECCFAAERRFAMKKKIPKFKNEDEEREFCATHDSTEYVDWKKAKRIKFPSLKPSTRTISIRLPESMLDDLKILANKKDVPCQSLLKSYLAERIRQELGH